MNNFVFFMNYSKSLVLFKTSKELTLPTKINKYWSYIAPFLGCI